ncbi:MAG: hypothetical protein RL095_2736 [Verrucomicrobiota bacterium]|jgi:hypothetical protein
MEIPLDPALLRAYRASSYLVPSAGLRLRLGEPSPELDSFLRDQGCAEAAFLSASNPWSRLLPDAENRRRHEELRQTLTAAGWTPLEALGQADAGEWPGESSFFVPAMGRADLLRQLQHWQQCAGLHFRPGHEPELVLNPGS